MSKKETNPKGAPHQTWADCVQDVKKKGGPYNPYAVCGASVHRNECEGNCADLPGQSAFTKKKKEAISGSSMPQLGRAGVQNVKVK